MNKLRDRERLQTNRAAAYRYRDLIERFVGKLKHARGWATRYDERADNFPSAIKLFSARLRINAYEPAA